MNGDTVSTMRTQPFINNKYVTTKYHDKLKIYNPTDETLVTGDVQICGPEDVNDAVDAASDAFEIWKTWTGARRAKCLLKLADLLEANCERLAKLETMAMGMPFIAARELIRTKVAEWFRYYAGWCTKLGGEYYPDDDGEGFYKLVTYEPMGVCAAVASWNATFLYAAWKIAPAVAAGNTIIFKASERSPLGALAMGDLIKQAGFPPGVINIVSGGEWTGFLLAQHKCITKVSFTGSHGNGKRIHVAATHSNMKRVTLELGGKNPSIVFEDADFGNALHHNSYGFLLNTGQACVSGSRLFVHEEIADGFIRGLVDCFKAFTTIMGDPMEPNTLLGPLVDKRHYDKVMYYIAEGQKEGAQLLCGGVRKGDKGWFVEPAILLNPPTDSCVYRDEIFGPVLVVRTFKDEEEVIEMANDTMYGLSASVFTKDIVRAMRISSELKAGTVSINSGTMPTMSTPFGGFKQSGFGRESGKNGLMEYLEPKTILIDCKPPPPEDEI
ncbi:hypothetical protein DTO166G4_7352 [Paecilomyces variotii]|nr:hypothetical protein DTO166G4_7352 [Paecilomyces variotii]KAJ9230308.1 hypothetical protein DTO166G5_7390 [Paecilomyces variotii]KAJ9265206.1 hypothetical protein DTO195F2_1818 [Paecilomyces variotii]KAJ9320188.1 hypothetical protein DTO027B3_8784 [Paecilomyces variotii]KAJ9333096.1 hypothetical protein DTO027B5_5184 [Paecilomyces variotii]